MDLNQVLALLVPQICHHVALAQILDLGKKFYLNALEPLLPRVAQPSQRADIMHHRCRILKVLLFISRLELGPAWQLHVSRHGVRRFLARLLVFLHSNYYLMSHEPNHDFWSSFISGGLAGICAKTVIAPFERIKLLYLTRAMEFTYAAAINDAKFIYRNHGIVNFWRGNQANVIRIFPQAAINFSTFDFLRNRFAPRDDSSKNRKLKLFFCGLTSGVVAQSISYPFDFLRTRLAMQKDAFLYSTIADAAKKIYQQEGLKAFYTGLIVGILGVGFYHGSGFFFFTLSKEYIKDNFQEYSTMKSVDFVIGASGAIVAQILAYPFDIMKKRMQGQKVLLQQGEIAEIKSTLAIFQSILKGEGIRRGFYKGVTLNFIKAPLSSGTAWMVKNSVNRQLNKRYDL